MPNEIDCWKCDGRGWYWVHTSYGNFYTSCTACGGMMIVNPPGTGKVTIPPNIILGEE